MNQHVHFCPHLLRAASLDCRAPCWARACAHADELTKTGKSTDAGITALVGEVKAVVGEVKAVVAQVKRLADASGGVNADSGTPTKAVGATFNPFAASVGALGGDEIRVTFPKGMHTARAVTHRTPMTLGNFLGRVGFTTHVHHHGTSAAKPTKSVLPPVTWWTFERRSDRSGTHR